MIYSNKIKIIRIANACVLIQIGRHMILTDPYFLDWPIIGIKEPVAMTAKELPPLTAIIGCHDFIDHWQMAGLKEYPHDKNEVQVFVPMKSMVRKAKKIGFNNASVLSWGEKQILSGDLSIESVKAQKMLKIWTVNNYVLRCGDASVFFGSEARDLLPLVQYNEQYGPVDVALLPTNAVHLFGLYKLVMSGSEAARATQILGAKNLVVIHDSHPNIPGLIHIKSSWVDADDMASQLDYPPVEVIRIPTGFEWTFDRNFTSSN